MESHTLSGSFGTKDGMSLKSTRFLLLDLLQGFDNICYQLSR